MVKEYLLWKYFARHLKRRQSWTRQKKKRKRHDSPLTNRFQIGLVTRFISKNFSRDSPWWVFYLSFWSIVSFFIPRAIFRYLRVCLIETGNWFQSYSASFLLHTWSCKIYISWNWYLAAFEFQAVSLSTPGKIEDLISSKIAIKHGRKYVSNSAIALVFFFF